MIKGSENDVVVISKEDWAAIEETIYLNSIHGYIDSLKEVMSSSRSEWVNAQELGL
jgi:PHD/YefM family antitoxin component YafN of YafNO toxin-antitoxin module